MGHPDEQCEADPVAEKDREIRRLREALEFYADHDSYRLQGGFTQPVLRDGGSRARNAEDETVRVI